MFYVYFHQGISTLSWLGVSEADGGALLDEAVAGCARVLDSESHERTLCVALDVLRAWCARPDRPLPPKILDILKVTRDPTLSRANSNSS